MSLDVVTDNTLPAPGLGRGVAFKTTTQTKRISCPVKSGAYQCALGFFPAGTRIKVTAKVPLPASMAGKKLSVTGTTTALDISTGKTTTLSTTKTTLAVPKKTVLGVQLGLVKKASSIKRKKTAAVKVTFGNGGVLAATKVKACVTVSKGAKIVRAPGAKIKGTSACWTLATFKARTLVNKKITVRAPAKKGTLKIGASLTPKSSQASKVSLAGTLPVK